MYLVIRETLGGGALRLSATSGAFLYTRLRPGVILTVSHGRDIGEFGTSPLELITREHKLFNHPVQWFFDATHVENPKVAVSEQWTSWLSKNHSRLAQMHILTSSAETQLRIAIARHFSNASRILKLYSDRESWTKALLNAAQGLSTVPDLYLRLDEPAVSISRTESVGRGIRLQAPNCVWSFRALANSTIFSTFRGDDSGDLTDAALDEMENLMAGAPRKTSWFLDLRDAQNVSAYVSQVWTEWLAARHNCFARVTAYASSPLFPLVLTVAKYRSGADHLFRIHRDLESFRLDLVKVTSTEFAASVGIG